ncbi:MAG: hypothetical protein PHR52_08260 [Fermentimonas sp.]|jgi:hypothetical protein|nr:hypothetical protein [Fermentimonas sp.]
MKDQLETVEKQLQQIVNMLIINGSLLGNSGLWYGKTGVAIFFFHYARYTNIELFEDYAVEIIDAMQAEIHRDSAANYCRGLSGIGVGIEYLSQKRFLGGDMNEILEDFDQRIRHDIMYRTQENNSLANGLSGLGQYLLYRLQSHSGSSNELCLLINQESMMHVVNLIENENDLKTDDLPDILSFLCRLYTLDFCNPKIDRCIDKILDNFSVNTIKKELLPAWVLALLRLSSIRGQMTDAALQTMEKSLQVFSMNEETPSKKDPADSINQLLWLLQCKKLLNSTNINVEMDKMIDALTENVFCWKEDEVLFQKGKLSLKGYAGIGLAMMILSGKCDDAWLDLLG